MLIGFERKADCMGLYGIKQQIISKSLQDRNMVTKYIKYIYLKYIGPVKNQIKVYL